MKEYKELIHFVEEYGKIGHSVEEYGMSEVNRRNLINISSHGKMRNKRGSKQTVV